MPEYTLKIVAEAVAQNQQELEKLKDRLDAVKKGGKESSESIQDLAEKWAGSILGAGTFVKAGQMVIDVLKQSVAAYAEAELAEAKRNAIFEATNGSTRTSTVELDRMADALSRMTAVDDDVIIGAQEMALQFRSIGGDLLPQMLKTAVDMAGGFRGDVIGSTESLGRMLELVASGGSGATMAISTLRRQNVILNPEIQKNIISLAEQGKTAEAQTALLNALADVMGGRAAAAADTLAGKQETLKNSTENLKEAIGAQLAPEIERQLGWINQSVQGWTQYIQVLGRAKEMADANGESWYNLTGAEQQAYMQSARYVDVAKGEADLHDDITAAIDPEIIATQKLEAEKRILAAALAGDVQNAIDSHTTTIAGLKEEEADLVAELERLQNYGYGPTSQAIQDVNERLQDNRSKQAASTQAMREAISVMLYQQASAKLNAAGQLELARALGLISEKDYAIAKGVDELAAKYDAMDGQVDGIIQDTDAYIKAVQELKQKLENIPPETYTQVITEFVNIGTPPPGGGSNPPPNPPPLCFLAGTRVTMADGSEKNIEDVKVGEMVMTFDFTEGRNVAARVTETFRHEADLTDHYYVVNQTLNVTGNHPLLTPRGWRNVDTLEIGDELGTLISGRVIQSIERVFESVETFNLHVDHYDHNYYANGYLAHNKTAEGGVVSGPMSGYWNAMHGTEAVIPLKDGAVPVTIMGGGMGQNFAGANINFYVGASAPLGSIQQMLIDAGGNG